MKNPINSINNIVILNGTQYSEESLCLSNATRKRLRSDASFLSMTIGFLLYFLPLQAQDWETYGYAKYLFSITENESLTSENMLDHQLHLRINNRWYPTDNLSAGVEFRLRGFYGDLVKSQFQSSQTVITDYPYKDLSKLFWEKKSSLGYGQIDRLFLNYNSGDWQFTIGRQRIAWGTSFVWNITDLFNPQSVLDFDYEEMPGSDALRIQYFTGVASRLEIALKPSPNKFERTAALFWLYNQWDYDFYLIAAWQHDKPILATAFAGDIYGAGFRGEFKISDAISKEQLGNTLLPKNPFFPVSNYSESNKKNINAVLSLDYTFPNSFYLHSEILYNSIGKANDALLYNQQALKAGLLSPSQLSLFFETAYNIHPLVRGSFFLLHNPNDQSSIFVPSISWSVVTNLDLYLVGFLTEGDPLTEYGSYGKAFFFRTKYSF